MAALEADTWARSREVVPAAREWQSRADAAVQAELDVEGGDTSELGKILVVNPEASKVGTPGRFAVTHLVVPTSLRRQSGSPPRSFCGWAFGISAGSFSFTSDLGAGEVCAPP